MIDLIFFQNYYILYDILSDQRQDSSVHDANYEPSDSI